MHAFYALAILDCLLAAAVLAIAYLFVTGRNFRARIEAVEARLTSSAEPAEERRDLPAQVSALARRLGVPKQGHARLVRLSQSGVMWMQPGARAMPFSARQILCVAQTGFLWRAWFRFKGVGLQVIDYLLGEQGGLEARLLDAVPMAYAVGDDTAFRGEAMRYLSEIMWNPDAIMLNKALSWRVIDAHTLALSTGSGARHCEVRLLLDAAGDLLGIEAKDRPRKVGKTVVSTPWFGRASQIKTIGGRRIPTEAEVGWMLDGVEFIYWRGRIESWEAMA